MASKKKTIELEILTIPYLKEILEKFGQPKTGDKKDLVLRLYKFYNKLPKGSEKNNVLNEIMLRLEKKSTRPLSSRIQNSQKTQMNDIADYLIKKIKGSTKKEDNKNNSIYILFGRNNQHHIHIYKNVRFVISIRISFDNFDKFELRYDYDKQKLCNSFNFSTPHLHIFRPYPFLKNGKKDPRRRSRVCLTNQYTNPKIDLSSDKEKKKAIDYLKRRIDITNTKLGSENALIIPPNVESLFNKDYIYSLKYISKINNIILSYINNEKYNHSNQFTIGGNGKKTKKSQSKQENTKTRKTTSKKISPSKDDRAAEEVEEQGNKSKTNKSSNTKTRKTKSSTTQERGAAEEVEEKGNKPKKVTRKKVTPKNSSSLNSLVNKLKKDDSGYTKRLRPRISPLNDIQTLLTYLKTKFENSKIKEKDKDKDYLLIFGDNHLHIYKLKDDKINIGVRINIKGSPHLDQFELRYDYIKQSKCTEKTTTKNAPYYHLFRSKLEHRGTVYCFNKVDIEQTKPKLTKILSREIINKVTGLSNTQINKLEKGIEDALEDLYETLVILYHYSAIKDTPIDNNFGGNKKI